jgi:acyl-CoA thioesterase-1
MRWLSLGLILAVLGAAEAKAQVVALGDSETRGYLLPLSDAWPAKLEGLLHQRGINVSVTNEGVNGDTSDGMLSRLDSAVPGGTRVVILMCCGNDNKDKRNIVADHLGNVTTLVSRLRARGIAVVYSGEGGVAVGFHDDAGASAARSAGASWCGRSFQGLAPEDKEDSHSPAGIHPTPSGHDKIAARMLPCVMRALGRKG